MRAAKKAAALAVLGAVCVMARAGWAAPVAVGEPVLMPAHGTGVRFYPGQLIVRFKPEAQAMDAAAFRSTYALRGLERLSRNLDLRAATFDGDEQATLEMAQRLSADPRVLYAHPAYELRLLEVPNDPYAIDDGNYSDRNPDQFWLNHSNVYEGWDITKGQPGIVVAVIDSGVDVDHPDLAANLWRNPGEVAGNRRDDDNNGFVDDTMGWDWIGQQNGSLAHALTCQFAPNSSFCQDNNPDIAAGDASVGDGQDNLNSGHADGGVFHGTHVAGIIAGVINNGAGVAGAAPKVRIMALRVGTPEGGISPTGLIAAMDYAIDNGAKVINLSLGVPADANVEIPGLKDMCQAAFDRGVAVIAAAGNGGKPDGTSTGVSAPASYTTTLAVGSCNTHDSRSRYSDYGGSGNQVGVCAYGGELNASFDGAEEIIWSTGVASKEMSETNSAVQAGDHIYVGAVGTSMATPEAAGLAALVRSRNPALTVPQVFQAMRSGARDVGQTGVDVQTGAGVLDFYMTLSQVSTHAAAVGD